MFQSVGAREAESIPYSLRTVTFCGRESLLQKEACSFSPGEELPRRMFGVSGGRTEPDCRLFFSAGHFFLNFSDELKRLHAQSMGQGKDDGEADAALSAFNADNVDPLQPGLIGQGLLGDSIPYLIDNWNIE